MAVTINASTTAGLVQTADTSGVLTLQTAGTTAVSISASQVVTLTNALPVASGGTGVTTSTGSGAVVLGTSPSISGAVLSSMASSVITSGTAVASTSGTSIDFTSIPSWVKRITVMLSGVSTNGATSVLLRLGDSGGIENTGYLGSSSYIAAGSISTVSYTTGFGLTTGLVAGAADVAHGVLVLVLLDPSTNLWAYSWVGGLSNAAYTLTGGGSKSLSATLDRVRITTVNGTDTFDAGTINILFE